MGEERRSDSAGSSTDIADYVPVKSQVEQRSPEARSGSYGATLAVSHLQSLQAELERDRRGALAAAMLRGCSLLTAGREPDRGGGGDMSACQRAQTGRVARACGSSACDD